MLVIVRQLQRESHTMLTSVKVTQQCLENMLQHLAVAINQLCLEHVLQHCNCSYQAVYIASTKTLQLQLLGSVYSIYYNSLQLKLPRSV
ncbi:hypothetical protein SK128_021643 [Halocaridina rubra]|uniref:Uncharacterized protein n=1 Tax=Halocaridina rubra TaxID=373956 RepID=A0AAN8WWW2_HALRR